MRRRDRQAGFTLVELLVGIGIFAAVSVGMYQVLVSGTRGSDTAQDVARVSEQARSGFNRMVRDTREGGNLLSAGPTGYNVTIDFDGDGDVSENPNESGDYENLTLAFDEAGKKITLNGQVLIDGVEPIPGRPVFDYSSNFLEYDWDGNGVTTWQELDAAPTHGVSGVGNNNGGAGPDAAELSFVSSVDFAFRIRVGDRASNFYAEAQLRNRR